MSMQIVWINRYDIFEIQGLTDLVQRLATV